MSITPAVHAHRDALRASVENIEIALPAPGTMLEQDEEWVVVKVGKTWRRVRLHDYGDVYAVPGLYEKWVYEIFGCRSPQKIRELLGPRLEAAGADPASMWVFDLGAGNGYVADELSSLGLEHFVGVDIVPEAATAAERDRPGLYDDFVIGDLLRLDEDKQKRLDRRSFQLLTCVAALGFGDIPPAVFAHSWNHVDDGGWAAFTIKPDFLDERDKSGFSVLVRRMLEAGLLEIEVQETYFHRLATDGSEINYVAIVGRKHGDVPADWFDANP